VLRRSLQDVSPTLAEAFTEIKADYAAATQSRFRRRRTGIPASGASGDYHYRNESDYLRIMEYARDIDRNDGVVGQAITRLSNNVFQDGMRLHPLTGDEAINTDMRLRWNEWGDDPDACDVTGEKNFHEQAALAYRADVVDGDMFTVGLAEGCLQHFEGHRVRTPSATRRNVVNGVLLSPERKPLEYWVTREDLNPTRQIGRVSDIQAFPARDTNGFKQVFHTYFPKRLSQTRGISALAPIFDPVGMHDDTQFAHMLAAQVASCITFFRQRSMDFTGATAPAATGAAETETLVDGNTRIVQGIAPGMEIVGAPGETLSGFSPNIPNPEWFPHQMMILTIIAVNLGLPVAVLLLDPTKTNFSGWRGAIDQARIGFKEIQRHFTAQFHRNVYLFKMRQWIAEDAVLRNAAAKIGAVIFKHRWNSPTWPYIEPEKDVRTDSIRLDYCLTSPRRLHAERGNEWSEIVSEAVQDNALAVQIAKQSAIEINKKFDDDDPVGWRELIFLPGSTTGKDNKPLPPVPEPVQAQGDDNA
jgi:lambda family phage portal protein